ncbi:copper homeostasis protein CutC [Phocoenobacter skyensis]|uniref:PF03932 family protein CutC n=1 Tax=Phocoenobacter skyensis TaxID=97481 RepID=A0A1H7Y469_9PAST|nr:copper homeostasis protein CutC [Pasteurella skyensis]MDP8079943.1 copper homeostasis protein CutC [Pasteurella skyensis]MDP8085839.1 copper homeostasis protein CutC [Pasteurella skyensis]MDP8185717.1 copper homeostasis protein CutC [Pasteurella skyensis]QLB22339.1 copper homeostasis protein CutC [Pasteurella skyensis]SEM40920.1 copper homeostasis protein [Pasteurella skyensis]
MKFELCIDNIQSVETASKAKVNRVELCSALAVGGLTPSYGLIKQALHFKDLSHHVMIRPRASNFVFNQAEIEIMITDILIAKELGVNGVVIGALTDNHDIDTQICEKLIDTAQGMEITFHRAFDLCRDPKTALAQIIDLGCTRLLTSGLKKTAWLGKENIAQLVQQSNGRIQIMAGAGVTSENALEIVKATGIDNIHFSAKKVQQNKTPQTDVAMGSNSDYDNQIIQADFDEILRIKQAVLGAL